MYDLYISLTRGCLVRDTEDGSLFKSEDYLKICTFRNRENANNLSIFLQSNCEIFPYLSLYFNCLNSEGSKRKYRVFMSTCKNSAGERKVDLASDIVDNQPIVIPLSIELVSNSKVSLVEKCYSYLEHANSSFKNKVFTFHKALLHADMEEEYLELKYNLISSSVESQSKYLLIEHKETHKREIRNNCVAVNEEGYTQVLTPNFSDYNIIDSSKDVASLIPRLMSTY